MSKNIANLINVQNDIQNENKDKLLITIFKQLMFHMFSLFSKNFFDSLIKINTNLIFLGENSDKSFTFHLWEVKLLAEKDSSRRIFSLLILFILISKIFNDLLLSYFDNELINKTRILLPDDFSDEEKKMSSSIIDLNLFSNFFEKIFSVFSNLWVFYVLTMQKKPNKRFIFKILSSLIVFFSLGFFLLTILNRFDKNNEKDDDKNNKRKINYFSYFIRETKNDFLNISLSNFPLVFFSFHFLTIGDLLEKSKFIDVYLFALNFLSFFRSLLKFFDINPLKSFSLMWKILKNYKKIKVETYPSGWRG